MSKRIFTPKQIEELLRNVNVVTCSVKSITYHSDFKVAAIKKYQEGLPPREIFKQAAFDIDLIGHETPEACLKRWRNVSIRKGIQALSIETRGKDGGRPKTTWSTEKEKLKYLETQVAYLKAENAFLAKLRKQRLN